MGWFILSADGNPVPFFGLQLPPLVGASEDIAECAEEINETGGTVGCVLVALHAAAALAAPIVAPVAIRCLPQSAIRLLSGALFCAGRFLGACFRRLLLARCQSLRRP